MLGDGGCPPETFSPANPRDRQAVPAATTNGKNALREPQAAAPLEPSSVRNKLRLSLSHSAVSESSDISPMPTLAPAAKARLQSGYVDLHLLKYWQVPCLRLFRF